MPRQIQKETGRNHPKYTQVPCLQGKSWAPFFNQPRTRGKSWPHRAQQQTLVGLKMPAQALRCFRALNTSLWENPPLMVGPGHRKVTTSCFWKTESSSANSSRCLPEGPKCVFWVTAVPVSTSDLEVQLEQWITQWDYPSASVRPWARCKNKAPSVCKCQKVWKMRYKCICTTKFVLDLWREHLIRVACSFTPTQMHFFLCNPWKNGLSSFITKHWLHGAS